MVLVMETNHTNNGNEMTTEAIQSFLARHTNSDHSTSERRVLVSVVPSENTITLFGEDLVRNFDVYGRALSTRRCFVRESLEVPFTVDALCLINESHAVFGL